MPVQTHSFSAVKAKSSVWPWTNPGLHSLSPAFADIQLGGWDDTLDATAPSWDSANAFDALARTPYLAAKAGQFSTRLSHASTTSSGEVIMRLRGPTRTPVGNPRGVINLSGSVSAAITITVTLYQGATQIQQWSYLTGSFTSNLYLTQANAANITDWNDLRFGVSYTAAVAATCYVSSVILTLYDDNAPLNRTWFNDKPRVFRLDDNRFYLVAIQESGTGPSGTQTKGSVSILRSTVDWPHEGYQADQWEVAGTVEMGTDIDQWDATSDGVSLHIIMYLEGTSILYRQFNTSSDTFVNPHTFYSGLDNSSGNQVQISMRGNGADLFVYTARRIGGSTTTHHWTRAGTTWTERTGGPAIGGTQGGNYTPTVPGASNRVHKVDGTNVYTLSDANTWTTVAHGLAGSNKRAMRLVLSASVVVYLFNQSTEVNWFTSADTPTMDTEVAATTTAIVSGVMRDFHMADTVAEKMLAVIPITTGTVSAAAVVHLDQQEKDHPSGSWKAGTGTRRWSADAVNSIETITPDGTVTGGTFKLFHEFQETAAIAWDATVAAVQSACDTAFTDQLVVGGSTGGPWTFEWTNTSNRASPYQGASGVNPLIIDDRSITPNGRGSLRPQFKEGGEAFSWDFFDILKTTNAETVTRDGEEWVWFFAIVQLIDDQGQTVYPGALRFWAWPVVGSVDITHTLSAYIYGVSTRAHTLSALLQETNVAEHTLSSIVRKTDQKTATLSAFLLGQNSRSHTIKAFLSSAGAVKVRPDGDVSAGDWKTAPTLSQPLFQQIDEASASDTDYVYWP